MVGVLLSRIMLSFVLDQRVIHHVQVRKLPGRSSAWRAPVDASFLRPQAAFAAAPYGRSRAVQAEWKDALK
jgi:hypothetical protein